MLKENTLDRLNKKLIVIFLILLPFLVLIRPVFDNDTYTLLNTGKYILNHGFPHIEPFTIHSNLHFMIEQWLTCAIFYLLYSHLGVISLFLLSVLTFYAIGLAIYFLCIEISCNKSVSFLTALVSSLFLSIFVVLRPQLFSLLIFLFEILILEAYIERGRKKTLLLLPLLSILLINLHSALWIFFFILLIPYIIDSYKINLLFIKGQGYPRKFLLFISIICIFAGLINPYGYESMTYIFKSYGNTALNSILEVNSPDFKSLLGVLFFIIYCLLIILYLVNKKSSTRLRYALITFGTGFLGLTSVRNIMLFIGLSYPLLSYYYKNLNIPLSINLTEKNKSKVAKTILIVILICLTLVLKVGFYKGNMLDTSSAPVKAAEFIKSNLDTERIRLYNDFNAGAYLEFEGIKTFIDPRAEVFFKAVNKKEDIMKDYLAVQTGKYYYKDFIKKYRLTHFLVLKGTLLYSSLSHDSQYIKLYTDDMFTLYTIK